MHPSYAPADPPHHRGPIDPLKLRPTLVAVVKQKKKESKKPVEHKRPEAPKPDSEAGPSAAQDVSPPAPEATESPHVQEPTP